MSETDEVGFKKNLEEFLDAPSYAGYLFKQGGAVQSWKKRWFAYYPHKGIFTYGKSPTQCIQTIEKSSLAKVEFQASSQAPSGYKKYGFVFALVNDKRLYRIACQTKEEAERWVSLLSPAPLFGVPLAEIMTRDTHKHAFLPSVVEQCLTQLCSEKIETEGLFRVSGSEKMILDYVKLFNTTYMERSMNGTWSKNLLANCPTHVTASLLKKFLRELPEPLIPYSQYQTLIDYCKTFDFEKESAELSQKCKGLVHELSHHHQVLLNVVMFLLHQVSCHNKLMGCSNLGLIFGQVLLRQKEVVLNEVMLMARIVEFMIVNYLEIFESEEFYLEPFKKALEKKNLAKAKKVKLQEQLENLGEMSGEIDAAMTDFQQLAEENNRWAELYSVIYHAIYFTKGDGDIVPYRTLHIQRQARKYGIEQAEVCEDEPLSPASSLSSVHEREVVEETEKEENLEEIFDELLF